MMILLGYMEWKIIWKCRTRYNDVWSTMIANNFSYFINDPSMTKLKRSVLFNTSTLSVLYPF